MDRAGKILKLYISISNFPKVSIGSSQIYVKMGFQGKIYKFSVLTETCSLFYPMMSILPLGVRLCQCALEISISLIVVIV